MKQTKGLSIGDFRLAIVILLAAVAVYAAVGQPIIKPVPIDDKPVLIDSEKAWLMYGKPVAYYHRVIMPDGSKHELKSRVPLSKGEWLKLAEKAYIEPEQDPEFCPHCGQLMPL